MVIVKQKFPAILPTIEQKDWEKRDGVLAIGSDAYRVVKDRGMP